MNINGRVKVTQVCSNRNDAFAVLRADGSVVTWGDALTGGNSQSVKDKLDGSEFAFTFTRELCVGILDSKNSDIHR